MIGSLIGNRYEVLREIGVGGMAKVYVAKCHYLNRLVAIKVLKEEFKQDNDFLRRFEAEAQAAGSLTHPNIVQIYDVGREGDLPYIVMEYIDGQTLKELIQNGGPIQWQKAIDLALQICNGIQKAHQKLIVHRDIKPQNILLTADGVPKVADFGIARATTAETATMKVDVIASVHYSSPEQVRGGYTDHTTDIYSMGVTLYEMLSGKLPFVGETTVSVAMKHIHDALPADLFEGLDIPEELSLVVSHAMAKLKADRYQDISELMADLEQIRATSLNPVLGMAYHKLNAEKQQFKRFQAVEEEDMPNQKTSRQRNRRKSNISHFMIPFVYVALVGILIALVFTFVNWIKDGLSPETTNTSIQTEFSVGGYENQFIEEVQVELDQVGVKTEIVEEFHATIPKGFIIKQSPREGTIIKIGGLTVVSLTVSKGPDFKEVVIPQVTNQNYTDVKFLLEDKLGLVVELISEYSDTVTSKMVIRSSPGAGLTVNKGDTITLYWSLGPEQKQVIVPDLLKLTKAVAEKRLIAAGLIVGKILPAGENVDGRTVTAQKPANGDTVLEGTAVDLTFSLQTEVTISPGDPTGTGGELIYKTLIIALKPQKTYGETVRLLVVVKDKASGVDTIHIDADVPSVEFPRTAIVPIPKNGGVTANAFVDGDLVLSQDY